MSQANGAPASYEPGSIHPVHLDASNVGDMTADTFAQTLPSSVALQAVTYDAGEASLWEQWLSDEEAACVASFGSEKRRQEFLAGRAAARQLLAGILATTPEQVPLRRADDDAVDVASSHWHVSIAHSGPHALAVCARHPIGVDLEHIQPRDPAIARFLFAPDDRDLIDTLPYDSDAALVLCWTLKEAVLKARRTGFRTSPKDLHLTVTPASESAAVTVRDGARWNVHYGRLNGYWGAVALPDSAMETST